MDASGESVLPDTTKAVLARLVDQGRATRRQLTADTGLSHPTVGGALADLQRLELASQVGATQGAMGRAAAVYGLGPGMGWVLGVDLGNTHVDVLARTLTGEDLRREHYTAQESGPGVVERAGEIVRSVASGVSGRGPLRAVAVAVGKVVPPRLDPDRPGPAVTLARELVSAMRLPSGVPIIFENNVNCAALAELHRGAARGRQDFGYLQIGVRIGLGIVMGGQLLRGANGAGGEVSLLPFPWAPDTRPTREALEDHLGSRALLERGRRAGLDPAPRTAEELFAAAAAGDPTAVVQVADHAREIGHLVAAVTAILDPELVVLGGGVGKNPQLISGVQAELDHLSLETAIAVTELGDDATLEGATLLTTDFALRSILDGFHSPLVPAPSVVIA